jgi:hypothetical protein
MALTEKFKDYRIIVQNNPYPSYHEGKYLEEYFYNYYLINEEKFKKTNYEYIPVFWTELYLGGNHLLNKLQDDLNSLDKSKKYFTVSQHDDAPFQVFPPNVIHFSAGGNQSNTIPIPLICSPILNIKESSKDIFCSFVGSITQNIPNTWGSVSHYIRMKMLETLVDKEEYFLKPKHWSPEIKQDRQNLFIETTSRSKFTLCPRGYGASSFRLYEAMQLGSIPVYIYYNKPFTPFADKINWNDIAVLIDYKDIDNLDNILKSISEEKQEYMLSKIKEIYPKYFTLEGMCDNILDSLK